jgi:uncharacterized protein
MSEHEHVRLVQAAYAAFGRGDMPAFMDALADDVEWVSPGTADLPFVGTFRGKAAVMEGFGQYGSNWQIRVFEPREFIAQGDKVVGLVHSESTFTPTGQNVVSEWAHVITLRDGKAARFVSYGDRSVEADVSRGR